MMAIGRNKQGSNICLRTRAEKIQAESGNCRHFNSRL